MDIVYARYRKDQTNTILWQPLEDHLRHAACRASEVLQGVGLEQSGYLAGLLHDLGKYSDEFQQYLRNAADGHPGRRGSVNHTFAGVRALLQAGDHLKSPLQRAMAEVIAYGMGAHHGLFDCLDMGGRYGLEWRRDAEIPFDQVMERSGKLLAEERLDIRLQAAVDEILRHVKTIQGYAKSGEGEFALGLLARLVASAVMEGDRTDSAAFDWGQPADDIHQDQAADWAAALHSVESLLQSFPKDTPVQRVRSEISEGCLGLANHSGGVFRLTVPAGGGKTLSVLRAALAHAKAWKKSRIMFVMPLLAIIEQNAKEIRRAVGDSLEVLEHHSNVEPEKKEEGEKLDRRSWLTQTWRHPMIVTTLFQVLMAMFSSDTGCVRRFQSLCNSVIIIDEVQTVPQRMLSMWNAAVNFLAHCCGATVILCSATQPLLEEISPPVHQVKELMTLTDQQQQVLRRTTFHMLPGRAKTLEELETWIQQQMEEVPSLLVVCNTKREAVALTCAMEGYAREHQIRLFHLSAAMCPAHRTQRMEEMKEALQQVRAGRGPRVLCIATQVMDAGVDVSFHCMLRFLAGVDTVVQTAGRVNRHGESITPVPVFMTEILNENLTHGLKLIQEGKNATLRLLNQIGTEAGAAVDLADTEVIRAYYSQLYGDLPMFATHAPLPGEPWKKLFDLLGKNDAQREQKLPCHLLNQAFRYGGDRFEVFDGGAQSLVVPFGPEGEELYRKMMDQRVKYDGQYARALVNQSRKFAISVFQPVWKSLDGMGAIIPVEDLGLYVLNGHYSERFGLDLADKEQTLFML